MIIQYLKNDSCSPSSVVHLTVITEEMQDEYSYIDADLTQFSREEIESFKTICGAPARDCSFNGEDYTYSSEEIAKNGISMGWSNEPGFELTMYDNETPCKKCFGHPDVLLSILADYYE